MENNETGTYCLCGEPFTRVEMAQHSTRCERCLWRKAENTTRAGMLETIELASREIVEYLTDENGEIDTTNLDDALTDNADSLVPVYTGERYREWYAADFPQPDDYGLESVGTSEDMATGLFGWYLEALTRKVSELLESVEQ